MDASGTRKSSDRQADNPIRELENLEEIAHYLKPSAGDVPKLPGIDICGASIPLHGSAGGDHIIYVDFSKRFDLKARIEAAEVAGRNEVVANLRQCQQRAGVALADASGHYATDALLTLMLHQAFLLGAIYELDIHGEITSRLFENINRRFYQSSAVHKYLTLLYGEISQTGTFRFIAAGHPLPIVFSRRYSKIVGIAEEHLKTFPPIGTMPTSQDIDRNAIEATPLGYKELYTANEINLMGDGDILLLFTDGLVELSNGREQYFPDRLENCLRETQDRPAREVCALLRQDAQQFAPFQDDASFVVIQKK